MTAEFDWWLLLVGIVAGAGLTWLVLADFTRHDRDVGDRETAAEAGWIARSLAEEGTTVDPALAEQVLRQHRRYLGLPPPDALVDPAEISAAPPAGPTEPPSGPRVAEGPRPEVSTDAGRAGSARTDRPSDAEDDPGRGAREPIVPATH